MSSLIQSVELVDRRVDHSERSLQNSSDSICDMEQDNTINVSLRCSTATKVPPRPPININLLYNQREKQATLSAFTLHELKSFVYYKFPEARKTLTPSRTDTHHIRFYLHRQGGINNYCITEDEDLLSLKDSDLLEVVVL
jgi:hypothetical protein